jgi:hypothetical protein
MKRFNAEAQRVQRNIEKHNREKANAYAPGNDTVCGKKSYDPMFCQACDYVSTCK